MYDEKQKFSVAMGLGVEKGLTSVTSGGGVLSGIKDFFFGDDSISEPKETKELESISRKNKRRVWNNRRQRRIRL